MMAAKFDGNQNQFYDIHASRMKHSSYVAQRDRTLHWLAPRNEADHL